MYGSNVIKWRRDFVLYIFPLGLVRLRTFRLSTWVSKVQTWAQVLTRAQGGCVVHWCQNKNPSERLTNACEWRHAPENARGGLWGFWKSQLVELRTRHRTRRVDFRGSQRPDEFVRSGAALDGGQMEKPESKDCVSLFLMSKNFLTQR